MKQNRVHVRLPDSLAHHVEEMCGEDGLYDNASEFFRDLARQHYEKTEHEKIIKLNSKLAPLLNRPLSECIEIDAGSSIEEFKQRCRAKRKSKK